MQRPPQMPSILSTRQSYQWINRLANKHKAFIEHPLSTVKQEALAAWVEVEFLQSVLALEGEAVSREEISRFAASETLSGSEPAALLNQTLRAFRELKKIAQNDNARLDLNLLLRLQNSFGAGALRKTIIEGSSIRPENLPIIVEHACRWFTMHSITELNPIEQAAIAFLRFMEIAPFESGNERTSLLVASFLTVKKTLPPIILRPHQHADYRIALCEGLQMNTQPMVELVAQSIEATLDEMLRNII
ncbi:MAG: Fic family protein [Acidobacteriota bacterium]